MNIRQKLVFLLEYSKLSFMLLYHAYNNVWWILEVAWRALVSEITTTCIHSEAINQVHVLVCSSFNFNFILWPLDGRQQITLAVSVVDGSQDLQIESSHTYVHLLNCSLDYVRSLNKVAACRWQVHICSRLYKQYLPLKFCKFKIHTLRQFICTCWTAVKIMCTH
jgi:hypothetical protein